MGKRKPRTKPPRPQSPPVFAHAFFVEPALSQLDERRVTRGEIDAMFARLGLESDARWHALEAAIGGLAFGEGYQRVWLGLRPMLRRTTLWTTSDGRALIDIGVQGDMHFALTLEGEVWAQDGIADRHPHREEASLAVLADRLRWPIADRVMFTMDWPARARDSRAP